MKTLLSVLLFIATVFSVQVDAKIWTEWPVETNIATGDYILGHDRFLILQSDANLCLYYGTGPSNNLGYIWCILSQGDSSTPYKGQLDRWGVFCVYRNGYILYWCQSDDPLIPQTDPFISVRIDNSTGKAGVFQPPSTWYYFPFQP